jgi:hypothetical protein
MSPMGTFGGRLAAKRIASHFAALRPLAATPYPEATSVLAVASPMPDVAPVTIAMRSYLFCMASSSFSGITLRYSNGKERKSISRKRNRMVRPLVYNS